MPKIKKQENIMFKNLIDFSCKRNIKEAIGFYIAYFVLFFIVAFILGFIGGSLGFIDENQSSNFGHVIAIISVIAISFLILKSKRLFKFGYIILALFSGVLALFGGALLGMIVPAFITTRGESNNF